MIPFLNGSEKVAGGRESKNFRKAQNEGHLALSPNGQRRKLPIAAKASA